MKVEGMIYYETPAATVVEVILNTQILASHNHSAGYDRNHLAASAAINLTPVAPKGTSGWFLGSVGQWKLFLESCGITLDDSGYSSDATLAKMQSYFREAGYQEFWTSGKYWTSTESTNRPFTAF